MMPFVRRRVKSNEIVYVTNVGKNVVFYLNIHVLSFVDDYFLVDCIGMMISSHNMKMDWFHKFFKTIFPFLFIYRCSEPCHRGNCTTCPNVSFDELSCFCGAQIIYPPIPCGIKPPACDNICSRWVVWYYLWNMIFFFLHSLLTTK